MALKLLPEKSSDIWKITQVLSMIALTKLYSIVYPLDYPTEWSDSEGWMLPRHSHATGAIGACLEVLSNTVHNQVFEI